MRYGSQAAACGARDTAYRSCLECLVEQTRHTQNVCRDYVSAISGLSLAHGDVAGLLSLVSGSRPEWRMLTVEW